MLTRAETLPKTAIEGWIRGADYVESAARKEAGLLPGRGGTTRKKLGSSTGFVWPIYPCAEWITLAVPRFPSSLADRCRRAR